MYHLHLARIRSLSAFCRLLIASHLFSVVSPPQQFRNRDSGSRCRPIAIAKPAARLTFSKLPIFSGGQMNCWNHNALLSRRAHTPIADLRLSSKLDRLRNRCCR